MNVRIKGIFEVLCVLIAIFVILILFLLFIPYISSSNISIWFKILYELSPFILMAGLVTVVCKLQNKPVSIGLGFKNSHILKQLVIAAIIFAITISFIIIPLLCGVDKNNVLSHKARSLFILIYYVIKAVIFVGVGEELVWRGYFYGRIKEIANSGIWAVVISSILFGLSHYPVGQSIMQVLMTSILGLIYGFARLKIKECSTFATGIAHGMHDAVISILSYVLM